MIFISYTFAESASLRVLSLALKERGVSYWSADGLPTGTSFPREMNDALESATHFAALWSAQASKSEHVWNEIDAFYTRHPQPSRMVFIRMDSAIIPALYSSRLYLDGSRHPSDLAADLHRWISGDLGVATESVPALSMGDAEASYVSLIPAGPAVRTRHISRELIDQYAEHVSSRTAVSALLDDMSMLREAAEPGVPRNQLLTLGELLRIGEVAPRDFWIDAFSVASKKGTRTLASLLLAQPAVSFSDAARADRIRLLSRLRTRDASLFA